MRDTGFPWESGQWIVTQARLGNPGPVTRYVPVTGYHFIQRVRLKVPVKNQNLNNSRFSIFVDVALRAASILKNHDFPFCGCCPAGGLDLKKSHFLYLFNVLQVAKLLYFDGFEHREYAKLLSFEKCFKMH